MSIDDTLSRVPPSDVTAERELIASALTHPDLLIEVMTICDAEDFYAERHRRIWTAILRVHRESAPVDAITVTDALRRAGDLGQIVAPDYLVDLLASAIDVPSHAAAHARIVREHALKRAVASALTQIAADAYDGGDSRELIANADTALSQIRERQIRERPTTAAVLRDAAEHLDDTAGEAVATGFHDLDRALAGGFRRGESIVLAAPTSRGKSALALNIAARVARAGGGAVFFSLEMAERELARRLLCGEGQVSHLRALEGGLSTSEVERIDQVAAEFSGLNFALEYRPSLSPLLLRAIAQRYARQWGRLDLIVADYVDLMKADTRQERREREVAAVSRDLKLVGGEFGCAMLICAQFNRGADHREDGLPRLSDLRDSGAIEQDADAVLFLHRPSDDSNPDLIVAKNRRGPLTRVPLVWRPSMTRFEDAA